MNAKGSSCMKFIGRQAQKKKRFHAYKKISTNKARSLHLHNFHTSLGALGIQCQSQDLIQGMDCIFLEVVVQRK